MRVAVTGCTSDFGAVILPRLLDDPDVDEVVGVSRRRAPAPHPKLRSERVDVRSPRLADLFKGCDAVVHLAFVVEEIHDKRLTHDVNVRGSQNVVECAHAAGVRRLVLASSVSAYGIHALPELVGEDVFPRGNPDRYYFYDKAEVEHHVEWWLRRHPGAMEIVVLRPPFVFGPHFSNAGIDAMVGAVFALPQRDAAAVQLMHERDLAAAFHTAVKGSMQGVYNVAPHDRITFRELAEIHGQVLLGVPERAARKVADALFALRLLPASGAWVAPGEACVDPSAFTADSGWRATLTSREVAHVMLLQCGRPILRTRGELRRDAVAEAALEPATDALRRLGTRVGAVAHPAGGSRLLEQALATVRHVLLPAPHELLHLEVHQAEATDAPVVIVDPGPGLHARLCTPVCAALAAAGLHVVALDRPGHGLSTGRRGDSSPAATATAVEAATRWARSRMGSRVYLLTGDPPALPDRGRDGPVAHRMARALANGVTPARVPLRRVLPPPRLAPHVRALLAVDRDGVTCRSVTARTALGPGRLGPVTLRPMPEDGGSRDAARARTVVVDDVLTAAELGPRAIERIALATAGARPALVGAA